MTTAATTGSLSGRELELGQILRLLDRAATSPSALVLEGEPGIGKTTLSRAGVQTAAERGCSLPSARPAEPERETERLIADLVAQGRSNKEVATALLLSPKTVEWNLSKVYAKLGVRSRAELAGRRH